MERHDPRNSLRYSEFCLLDRTIRPDLNRIERGGVSVPIEPRVMDVLVYLAENAGRVVSREELLDRIWGETIVVEHVLTRAVSELRRVLDDDADHPRFVETIRKRGYRLIAPVTLPEAGGAPAEPGGPPSEAGEAGAPRRSQWGPFLWPALAVLLGALAWNLLKARQPDRREVVLNAVPFTTFVGDERHATFSPDGTRIAFGWNGPQADNFDIYVKQRDSETPLRLTEDPGLDDHAAWSPDGSEIAFARWSEGAAAILAVPSIGGAERTLYRAASWVQGLDWASDGQQIVFSERTRGDESYRLRVLDLSTLATRDLSTPPAQHSDFAPRVSPDGLTVAFIRSDLAWHQRIYVIPLRGGQEPRHLTGPLLLPGGLTWRPGGREIIFTSAPANPAGLWSLSPTTGAVTPLIVRDEWVGDPSCPRSGAGLVYQTWRCQSDVWEVRFADDGSAAELAEPLIQSMRWDGDARISPDGTRIVFASARSGHAELWICRRDGAEPVRLTSLNGASLGSAHWSPDSRRVAYHTSPEGYAAVHVVDAAGGRPHRLSHDPCNELPCAWSADGRWIFIASDRGDSWQIWKLRPDGSQRVQLTRDGGLDAQQSEDSRWIYYIKPSGEGLWRMAVDGGPEELIYDHLSRANRGNWAVYGPWVYSFVRRDGRSELVAFDVETRALRTIVSFDGQPGPGVAASPDGKALLYARTDDALLDLMLVDGFR